MRRVAANNSVSRYNLPVTIVLTILFISAGCIRPAAAQGKQLSLADILVALRSKKAEIDEKNRLLAEAVKSRGITFTLTPEIEKELTQTGAYSGLLDAIRSTTAAREPVAMQRPEPAVVQPVVLAPAPDFTFYRNRANKEITDNNLAMAIEDLGKAIELKPSDASTYLARAFVYVKQDKNELSLADFDKVIELDKKNVTAYFIRGQVHEKLGQSELALSDFTNAAALDPTNVDAVAAVARIRAAVTTVAKPSPELPTRSPVTPTEPKVLSVGALNDFATYLEKPAYTQMDRKMGLQGRVTVLVTLDEEGKVSSVNATEGPKQLRTAAEAAIRKSKFKPVQSGDKNVRVSGYVVFNFVANQ